MSKTIVQMVNTLEMVGFLKTNDTSCRFVSMISKTPVVKIKAGNPWGAGSKTKNGLYKVSKKIGIINANFNTSVRTRIAEILGVKLSEVEYENGETWYKHLTTADGKNLPLVQHKDETKQGDFYIQYYPHKSTNHYVNESGEVIPNAIVQPFLYKENERPEFKPAVIVVNLANVRQLKASGIIINMPDFEEAEAIFAQD